MTDSVSYPNTGKGVENMMCYRVFLMRFEVFG